MSHTPEPYIKEKEFLKILSINTDTEIYGNHEEVYLLYCLLDEFAQQEIQAMRTKIKSLIQAIKSVSDFYIEEKNKSAELEKELSQLRTDKARLVEAVKLYLHGEEINDWDTVSLAQEKMQKLLTEMEGGK